MSARLAPGVSAEASVVGVLTLVAAAACVVPVRRALAVDPVTALRSD